MQQKIQKLCRKNDILCRKMESPSQAGWPDLILIKNGDVLFWEVKNPNGKGRLSKLQLHTITEITDHGGHVNVIDSLEQAEEIIAERFNT